MSGSLQGLQKRRDFGMEKLKQKKYVEAREDFKHVVDNLVVDNDQKAALKMLCYNQIALCDIELGEFEQCKEACAQSYNIFSIMRPDEKNKKQNHKNDILYPHYHTILVRLGQIEEKQKNYRQALRLYQQAINICPKGEATQLIQYCLVNFGIPPIDTEDPSLMPYSKIYQCVFGNNNFLNCYQECITKISENIPDQNEVKRLDDAGIVQMMLGVNSFLISDVDNENADAIIDISLTLIALFIRKGAMKVWANSNVIIDIVTKYKDNLKLLQTCLSILEYLPPEKFKLFTNQDFIHVWIDALKLDFTPEQVGEIMKLLFYILNTEPKLVDSIVDTEIFDLALKIHTNEAFLLVRALMANDEMVKRARTNGTVDWTLSMIEENINTTTYLHLCLLILIRIILVYSENEAESKDFDIKQFAGKCFTRISKIIKEQKDETIIADSYSVLQQIVKYAKEQVQETKIILITSVHLASHIKTPDFEAKLLKFLYQCSIDNLVDELIAAKPLLPTIMKVLDSFPNRQPIVEYSISLAVSMNHPNRLSLLQGGLLQFPNSQILQKHIDLLKEAMNKEK
ncbi:hypothetical protein M9Y10_010467 [Tritrichomonas musculus]|uniref:TPR Domain containing protein n=1 Tax=Tritrichomonas musculus TaxID=1915356 RepID=A0ABR2IKU8_9EUKA